MKADTGRFVTPFNSILTVGYLISRNKSTVLFKIDRAVRYGVDNPVFVKILSQIYK